MCKFLNLLTITAAVSFVVPASQARASLILVEPTPSNSTNFWPINGQGMHWQQVYNDAFFGSSPITINAFAFRGVSSGSVSFGSDFTVRMSTTTLEPGSLSTTFASNVGADNTLVFSGPVTLTSSAGNFTTISLTTPFQYNPTMGNLLIEIVHNTPLAGSSLTFSAYNPTPAGLQRIATDSFTATTGTDFHFGELVTRFDVSPASTAAVPEPASMIMLGIGAVGLAGYGWRKRKQNAIDEAAA